VTRLVFAGTPALAATILQSLVDAGYDIPLVLTQPDRPAGRGLRVAESEVKKRAGTLGLNLYQPDNLIVDSSVTPLRQAQADIMIVAAYGLILPSRVLEMFSLGCVNVHASLLPRWRGAAPVQRAILAGDVRTGICIMKMEAGLDTGAVYAEADLPIAPDDNTSTLLDKLAQLGADTLMRWLPSIIDGSRIPVPQSSDGITYAAKIAKAEAVLDWSREATVLERQVRAFYGFPVAYSILRGETVRIWRARAEPLAAGAPGQIVDIGSQGILVACGSGALRLIELQRAGGRRISAAEFGHGIQLPTPDRFGSG
jgi:methionyl-tRNA formyltransferase